MDDIPGDAVPWYDVSWVDWLSVIGVAFALVGIYFAWAQAKNAAGSANKAKEAVERTQRQLRANQLFVLIPQLRWISTELENSIRSGDRQLASRNLHNWQSQAGYVHGILSAADSDEKKLLKTLQDSVGLAFAATTALIDESGDEHPVLEDCKRAREAIGIVCNQLTSWVGQASTTEPSRSLHDE